MNLRSLRILGAMTGTSCDGLDAACVEFDAGGEMKLLWAESAPYPAKLRARVLKAQLPGAKLTLKELLELHRDLGEWYGLTFRKMFEKNASWPDLIANHGQTMAHFPKSARAGMTLQLGDPSRIAFHTGVSVASVFRDGDMSAGGEGAPLAPLFHKTLAKQLDRSGRGVAIHNIGGISNFSYVLGEKLLALDTGPGNIWIDAATEKVTRGKMKFDRDGMLARKGKADSRAVEKIVKQPYFKKKPPKSTGRDDFPFSDFSRTTRVRGNDLIATATEVTVESTARAYEDFVLKPGMPLKTVYVCGGGARNSWLIHRLNDRLKSHGIEVKSLTDAGFDAQWVEANAFAYFGWRALHGQAVGGSWTGAEDFGSPSHVIPGKNWRDVLSKIDPKSVIADSL